MLYGMAENATQETAEFQSHVQSASTESPKCIQFWQANNTKSHTRTVP